MKMPMVSVAAAARAGAKRMMFLGDCFLGSFSRIWSAREFVGVSAIGVFRLVAR